MREDCYRKAEDGTLLVKKYVKRQIGTLSMPFGEQELWFPCLSDDPDKRFLTMFFGGWFGYHRFQEKRYLYGLFYFLTCGCFGVFYLFDLLEMLWGNYGIHQISYEYEQESLVRKKKRYYYAPLKQPRRAIVLLVIAFFLTLLLVQFIYRPVGTTVLNALSEWIANSVSRRAYDGLLAIQN